MSLVPVQPKRERRSNTQTKSFIQTTNPFETTSRFTALRRHKELQAANITHIVSAVDWKFAENSPLIRGFQHLQIPLDDVYDSNILEYFPRSNAFIHEALNHWAPSQARHGASRLDSSIESAYQSGVLVHW